MNAHQASVQIAEIQRRLTAAQTFRGYRAQTVALTGIVALAVSAVQPVWLPQPATMPYLWLTLWVLTAALCGTGVAGELALRCWRAGSAWHTRLTLSAAVRFLPCVVAGGALTVTLAATAPQTLWMLPGLWAILFSLGIWSSMTGLPREIAGAGLYYLVAGVACLVWARGEAAFAPLAMGLTFGGGQLLTAVLLHWRLETHDVEA